MLRYHFAVYWPLPMTCGPTSVVNVLKSELDPADQRTILDGSGFHTILGYLEAFTLAQIVPEKRNQILERADEYAHNREVCGVHYPTDVASGREAAYAVFGAMMISKEFQQDLAAARAETRKVLGLN